MTTDNRDREELEPCPFCGSTSIFSGVNNETHKWTVSCDKCPASIAAFDMEKVIAAWNSRAAVAAPQGDARCDVSVTGRHQVDAPYCKACGQTFTLSAASSYSEGFDDAARVSRTLNQVAAQPSARVAAEIDTSALDEVLEFPRTAESETYAVAKAQLLALKRAALLSVQPVEEQKCAKCGGSGEIEIGCAMDHALTASCADCGGTGMIG